MKIKINDSYSVEVEESSYTLYYTFTGKTKEGKPKDSETILGFISTLERVIQRITQHSLSKMKITLTLDEFLVKWKDYSDSLSKQLASMNIS